MQVRDGEAMREVVALNGGGGKTSLFCFPGAGGEATTFREMASLIESDHSVYGIDMQRFLSTDRKFTVEQLADFCLAAIRRKQARGPYYMCGYSFGALVAYEVASRLRNNGEDIGVVALIDTGNPAFRAQLSSAETTQLERTYVANRLRKYFRFLTTADFRAFANSFLALFVSRAGTRTRRLIRGICHAMNRPMPDVFRHNDRALFDAWRAYNPPVSALPLLLYYEAHRCAEYGGDRTLGWRLCTCGKVDVELGSGGHVEMMAPRNVRSFVAKLSGYLAGKDGEPLVLT
jgi:thioesterase domain-containing protein